MSNNLDPDQDQHYVGPDLDPNCLQILSADHKSIARKELIFSYAVLALMIWHTPLTLYLLIMDSSFWFHTINLAWYIVLRSLLTEAILKGEWLDYIFYGTIGVCLQHQKGRITPFS